MAKSKIRKNDTVAVISGKDRGARGRVLEVRAAEGRVLVEGVNRVKRHTRPNPQKNIKGGILEKENFLHISNVALIDPETDRPTRVGAQEGKGGAKVRVAKRSGKTLDR
jgi:large subunit ribosomal protein L24